MFAVTALTSSAIALAGALSGVALPAHAESAPAPVTIASEQVSAVAGPVIGSVLTSNDPAAPVLVVGSAMPGATVELTYRDQTASIPVNERGYWGGDLPGGRFGGGVRTITAVQIVDGVRSAPTTYEYQGNVLPF